jgi:hypothetical protein
MYPPRKIVRVARRRDVTDEETSSMQALYLDMIERLKQQYQPANLLETEAIHDIAAALSRLKQAREMEPRLFQLAFGVLSSGPAMKDFDRLVKYTDSLARQVARHTAYLLKMQETRKRQEKQPGTELTLTAEASAEEN